MEDTKHAPKAAAYNAITDGVIWKQLLLFAAPLLVGNLFQQLYNTVDSMWGITLERMPWQLWDRVPLSLT